MKRRLIIFSSLITIILSCFSFPIFAEETVQDSSNIHTLSDGVFLDSYFYDNYDLLPYINGRNNSYINSGYIPNENTVIKLTFSYEGNISENNFLFGIVKSGNRYSSAIYQSNDLLFLSMNNGTYLWETSLLNYGLYDLEFGKNVYVNNNLIYTFPFDSVSNLSNMFILATNSNDDGASGFANTVKLYKFAIYEYDSFNDSYEVIKYFYPAKSKSSGIIGLYDAVSKTFLGSNLQPFSNPTNEYVENFQISSFLTNSFTWIAQIFDAIIQMPLIIVFMAIGLAGAMFRWGRRIVHF